MRVKELHDHVKAAYENGQYADFTNEGRSYYDRSQLKLFGRIAKSIWGTWLVLLLATFVPASYSIAHRWGWLHNLFLVLLILNTLAIFYVAYKCHILKARTRAADKKTEF